MITFVQGNILTTDEEAIVNPVNHMKTDEEIIEFIIDCYNEDPDGRVYLRACQFLGDSRGISRPMKSYIERPEKSPLETNSHRNPLEVRL